MDSELKIWKRRAMAKFTSMLYTDRNFTQLMPVSIAERMVDATINTRPKTQILEDKEIVKQTLEKVLTFERVSGGKKRGHISVKMVREWLRRLE